LTKNELITAKTYNVKNMADAVAILSVYQSHILSIFKRHFTWSSISKSKDLW